MNYFELFDIPVRLHVHPASLSKKFFELSRKYHPDYFTSASAEEQEDALQKSALINKAWATFRDPDATINYVLKLKGMLVDDEKFQLPPSFLMEVMDLNEQLTDADSDSEREKIISEIDELGTRIFSPVKKIIDEYDDNTSSSDELLQVKEYYFKKKYLDRMKSNAAKQD